MRWILLILLAGCTITGLAEAPFIPEETNLPIEVYFCQITDCIGILQQYEYGSCAIYNSNLIEFKDVVTKDDRASGLMHNKFCVMNNTVITGSLNPTKQNVKEANNILRIHSKYVAELYSDELKELKNNQFGSGEKVKYPKIQLNNQSIKVRFCPEDNCREAVVEELEKAGKSIHFALNAFTDDILGDLLVEKSKSIEVNGVLDSGIQEGSEKEKVKNIAEIRKNIHHKFFIIDRQTVIAGSANPSRNGYEKNDENIVIINSPEIAEKYEQEVSRLALTS